MKWYFAKLLWESKYEKKHRILIIPLVSDSSLNITNVCDF